MEKAPANSKESPHSAHANGMNEWINMCIGQLRQLYPDFVKYYVHKD